LLLLSVTDDGDFSLGRRSLRFIGQVP